MSLDELDLWGCGVIERMWSRVIGGVAFCLILALVGGSVLVSAEVNQTPDTGWWGLTSADSVGVDAAVDSLAAVPAVFDSLAAIPAIADSLVAVSSIDELAYEIDVFEPLLVQDDFGFLAAWEALVADTTTVRPLTFAPLDHPVRNPILLRILRRQACRDFMRTASGVSEDLRDAFFYASDSIAIAVDAQADSLVDDFDTEVASSVFFRASLSGGMRYLPVRGREFKPTRGPAKDYSVDLASARIVRELLYDGTPVYLRVNEPYALYLLHLTRCTSRRLWKREIRTSMREVAKEVGKRGLTHLTLPFEMPPAVKSILGEGKPSLSVSGSERITFGGRSQWFPDQPTTEFRKKQSKFPQLEMKQDLTIRLKGSIGDKLDVDVDQSSQSDVALENKIKIRYKGYEDEIIRRIDLGNTGLRLPGTEYVSYGGSHTGLFGINTEVALGPVTVNMILSKQEGETAEKRATIRSETQTKRIYDYEFIRDRFFFLDDPTRDAYPSNVDPLAESFVVKIRQGSVLLWLDDGDGKTLEEFSTIPGFAIRNLRSATWSAADTVHTDTLYFEQLEHEKDYWIYIDERFEGDDTEVHPYIVMNRYLDERSTLAVTYYDEGTGEQVGGIDVGGDELLRAQMIRPRNDDLDADLTRGSWANTNRLMLKNVYSLHPGAADWSGHGLPENAIMEEGFELSIHYQGTIDGVEDPDEIKGHRLIRYLGLDYFQQTDTGLEEGQDGKADVRPWVDLGSGLIYFPDLQPFAPQDTIWDNRDDPGDLRFFDLRGRPVGQQWDVLPEEHWNRGVYNRKSCVKDRRAPGSDNLWETRYYIEVVYKTPVTELRIDAWDIIEGSEVVTAGGRKLDKGREYTIDYQTGLIKILDRANVGEDQEINVTYKRAGGFGQASKTLVGVAAFYQPEDSKFNMSSSWLYQSCGSPDRRPRLGSEPTRTTVGEMAASYRTESMGLTRMLDRLPMLEARRPSKITVDGGIGVSFPNPNTRNDLYIDDFEGVADDTYIRLNRLAWKPCGLPLAAPGESDSAKAARKAELWWYTPFRGTREGDLNPTLEYLEAKDHKQVLELQFWPYPSPEGLVGDFWDADSSWAGIVQGLSGSYLDLTRARFLDIWINDFKRWDPGAPYPADRRGTMYVELGRMSEDAIWARRPIDGTTGKVTGSPHVPPNGALDTEDTNYDGELDLSDSRDEDTGLDGVLGKEGGANDDGANDDYGYSADSEREYSEYPELWETYKQINGTEGNGKLDTEDLDADNSFKRVNSYFQFKVDLADTSVVETDVAHDYGNRDDVRDITEDNGWRRIRIPLSDAFVDACINDPDWTEIKHLRIWFTAMGDPPPGEAHRIQIGGIEIRSNRWMAEAIRDTSGTDVDPDALIAMEEDFFPGVVSNKENADIYDAPFEVHRDRDKDNVPEKEQSLTLEVRNFQPGHTGSIYMPFLREQSYMGYEFLELWLNSTIPEHQDADFYFRLCKDANVDTTHYYEYRVPVPKKAAGKRKGSWKRVKIRLTDMSDLKNKVDEYNAMHPSDSTRIDTASVRLDDGARLSIKGQPNLTKIKRITMGVQNPPDAEVIEDASIWVDELRLTEVHRDVDVAYRVQVRAELSDFGKFDLSYKRVGADFASISGGGTRQRKETETALSTNASLPIDRLLPRQLGLRMPFSYSYDRRKRVPKYRTNDDLLVGDAPTDRDVTESANRSMSLSLSRNKSRSGLLKYTLDAVKVSGSHKTSYSGSPLSQDSTRTASMSVNYNTSLGSLGDMRLYRNWKVRLTPTNVGASLNRSQTTRTRYRRENGDLTRPFFLDDDRTTQSGALSLTTGMRPIQAVTYNFRQNRNLMLKGTALYIGGLNLGTETSRQEDLNATHTLRLLRGWFEPRLNWKGTFKGTFNEQSSGTGGSLKRSHTLTNNRSGSISGEIPLSKLLGLLGQISSRSGKEKDEKEEGEKDDSREQEQPEGTEFRNDRPSDPKRSTSRRPARGGVASSGLSGAVAKIVRLTRTNGSFSAGEQSTYSRVLGKPTIAYQLGLSMDPGVVQLSNGRESRSKNQGYGIDMDFKFLKTVSVSTTFKRSKSQSMSSGTHTENIESRWPEMDVRWGDLAKRFRLKRFIQTAKASTRYSRKEKSSKQEGELRKRETNAQWGPLVDLNMGFSNGVSVVFRLDYSSYCTEDLSGWHRESNRTNTRLSLSAKKNFKITREVTMPLTGSKQRVTTRLDLGMSLKLDRNRNATQEEGHKEQVTADTNRLDFSVDGSYQFTRSITGRVAISCGENADNKNKTKTSRYVAVNLSAGFTF